MGESNIRNYQEEIMDFIRYHFNRKAVGFLVIVMVLLYLITLIPSKIVYADQTTVSQKTFKSVEIQAGDTLWSIASEYYTNEYKNLHHYIEVIKDCNSLQSDIIHSGCYLIIPYYEEIAK